MQVIIDVWTIVGLVVASLIVTGVIYFYHRIKEKSLKDKAMDYIKSSWVFTINITLFFFILYAIRSL